MMIELRLDAGAGGTTHKLNTSCFFLASAMLDDWGERQIQEKGHTETDGRRWSVCRLVRWNLVETHDEFGNVAPVGAGVAWYKYKYIAWPWHRGFTYTDELQTAGTGKARA